jgi:uncharacterized DUF497 family protein
MGAHWDEAKGRANFRKHGIYFADVELALDDPLAISVRDDDEAEERWVTICMDDYRRVLVVVHTWRGEDVRLISARVATPREREQYQRGL